MISKKCNYFYFIFQLLLRTSPDEADIDSLNQVPEYINFLSIEFISDSCLTKPKILHYLLTGPECFETPPGTNGKNSSVVWKSCQEKRVSMRKFQCVTVLLGIEALVITIINFIFLPECLSFSLASPPCSFITLFLH